MCVSVTMCSALRSAGQYTRDNGGQYNHVFDMGAATCPPSQRSSSRIQGQLQSVCSG